MTDLPHNPTTQTHSTNPIDQLLLSFSSLLSRLGQSTSHICEFFSVEKVLGSLKENEPAMQLQCHEGQGESEQLQWQEGRKTAKFERCDMVKKPHSQSTPTSAPANKDNALYAYTYAWPGLITVARSADDEYTPPNEVEAIQKKVVDQIQRVYNFHSRLDKDGVEEWFGVPDISVHCDYESRDS